MASKKDSLKVSHCLRLLKNVGTTKAEMTSSEEKLDFHQKQKTKVENKNSSVFNTNSPLYFEFVLKLNKKIE